MNQTMWEAEMADLKLTVSTFANIPLHDIYGIRAPFLQIGGDGMFQMLQDNQFLYDSSMPTKVYSQTGLFPYTLDYLSEQVGIPYIVLSKYLNNRRKIILKDDKEGNPCALFVGCFIQPKILCILRIFRIVK